MKKLLSLLAAAAMLPAAPVPPKKPKLVLMIVVDQFRFDYLTRFRAQYNAGFARLLDNGANFVNAHYEHFPTITAVGHSTVLSGALPAVSGIVGNEWYDRENGKQVTSVSDPSVKTLGAPERTGASPRRLFVSTLGDELKMAGREPVKVIGISIKDRSAILPVGHMADAAYWFDSATGNFVSSTYYFNDLPNWVNDFNRERRIEQWAGKQWLPIEGGTPLKTMPAQPGKALNDAVLKSAFGNELLTRMVERAIVEEKLGQNGGIDLLSVSYSCNDSVGHDVGPDDPQVRDISIRTDRLLGDLFALLDKRVGLDNVLVVLTADHGVAPLPELMKERKMPGGRIPETVVLSTIEEALGEKYGPGPWVIGKSGPSPFLDHRRILEKKLSLDEVQATAAQAVRELPYISRVFTREDLRRGLALNDPWGRRVQNGFNYERASDLFIVAKPYWLFEEKGTSHGTPYNYDSHVPIVFMGPGIKPGKYRNKVAVNDIAPTLSTMLEVETPSGASGRVLEEMLH